MKQEKVEWIGCRPTYLKKKKLVIISDQLSVLKYLAFPFSVSSITIHNIMLVTIRSFHVEDHSTMVAAEKEVNTSVLEVDH